MRFSRFFAPEEDNVLMELFNLFSEGVVEILFGAPGRRIHQRSRCDGNLLDEDLTLLVVLPHFLYAC